MRPIDADLLKRSIQCSDSKELRLLSPLDLHKELVKWIDAQPTVDPARHSCQRPTYKDRLRQIEDAVRNLELRIHALELPIFGDEEDDEKD